MTFQLDTVAGLPQYAGIDAETGVPMDSKDRYLVPDPENPGAGRRSNQRCTNLAGMLDSRFALEVYEQNNLIMGMGHRDDLRMIAVGMAEKERQGDGRDKALLRQVRGQALAAGDNDVKANRGTGMHIFTEVIDAGGTPNLGSDQAHHAPALRAYAGVVMKYGIGPALAEQHPGQGEIEVPLHLTTEVVLHDPRIEVVGRVDKVRRIFGRNRIVDVKTGEDPLKHSALSYAMQLAILAHCPYRWDEASQRHYPATPVDREIAYLIHIPSGGDYAELIAVDIARAWRYVLLALQVRESRNVKASELASPLGRVGADEQVTPAPAMPFPLEASQAAAMLNGLPAVVPQHAAAGPGPSAPPPLPDATQVKVLVQNGERMISVNGGVPMPAPPVGQTFSTAPADLPGYGLAYVPDGIPGELAPAPAAGAPAAPETVVPLPAAGGEASVHGEPLTTQTGADDAGTAGTPTGRAKPKCARCRRPGHQTRTCNYLTHGETGAAIGDDKVSAILQSGKAPDEAAYKLAVVANAAAPIIDPDGVDEINDPVPPAPTHCRCTSGWEQSGWSNRGDGVWVHALCSLPSYAATMRSSAYAASQLPGQDPAVYAMSVQAIQFFTEHADSPPPPNLIEAGWPPPFTATDPPVASTSAPGAGATTTAAPALSSGGGTGPAVTSAPSSTAPSATPVPSPIATMVGATTPQQPSVTPPTAVPAAASPPAAVEWSWPEILAGAPDETVLRQRVQECLSAGGWDQGAAQAAARRQFELQSR